MLKVVIDTNLFVSSIISKKGAPSRLLQAWREHIYLLIVSTQMLEEIKKVLQYPHIKNEYNLKEEDITLLVDTIEKLAVVLHDVEDLDVIKEDPDDNKILACAATAKADCIVSGDKHLLSLGIFKDIPIISAREFLDKFGSNM